MSISIVSAPVETKTPPQFVFFPTERAHSFWRYFWPFLSIRQFILILAVSVVVAISCTALAPRSVGTIAGIAIPIGLVLAAIQMMAADQLPGKIIIATARGPARQLVPILEQIMLKCGYTGPAFPVDGDCVHFPPKGDAWLSWSVSPKQGVELCIADENIIEVRGPKDTLNSIEMFLRWKLEE
ncbi:hypothetical protein [Massilia scottii]|uniref:hypothetical protein n=1 Tax=Massilia scottii TaxID=3057166 RepID=UPI002796A25E|nr:hypothetical protein [Massilia sp. CCM 9029]MDQ1833795.1 hypothetical protein [Massilia sp. CCM 9029]